MNQTRASDNPAIRDPVCGMSVENDALVEEYHGRRYYFCSEGCRETFRRNPDEPARNYVYDLVILGGGPAGITAAVYASILKMQTFLIAMDIGGQAVDSTKIGNYMGFDFITGPELVGKFKDQFLNRHYLEHKIDEATELKVDNGGFVIHTLDGDKFKARAVIIATGLKRRLLGIPGEERLLRKGVSHGAVQDASLFAGKRVVVVGGGNSGIQIVLKLLGSGCRVTLVEKARLGADVSEIESLRRDPHAEIAEIAERSELTEILGAERVEGAKIRSLPDSTERTIPCEGVFIQVGLSPNTEFCDGVIELNEKREIKTKGDCSTNIEGAFACGDVTDTFAKRIIVASGDGAKAALRAREYLLQKARASQAARQDQPVPASGGERL